MAGAEPEGLIEKLCGWDRLVSDAKACAKDPWQLLVFDNLLVLLTDVRAYLVAAALGFLYYNLRGKLSGFLIRLHASSRRSIWRLLNWHHRLTNVAPTEIRTRRLEYGVAHYQDTILPVFFGYTYNYSLRPLGSEIQFQTYEWDECYRYFSPHDPGDDEGDGMNRCRLALGNLSSCMKRHLQIVSAIVARQGPDMVPYSEWLKKTGDHETAVLKTVAQLAGKRIAATFDTEMEQLARAAVAKGEQQGEMRSRIIHSSSDRSLLAFQSGEVDAFVGGLTERFQARRHGAIELITSAELTAPVINGFVVRRKVLEEKGVALCQALQVWFETIRWMEVDVKGRSEGIRDYLAREGSTKYSAEEYEWAWENAELFPSTIESALDLFLDPGSPYYWRDAWRSNNEFLRAKAAKEDQDFRKVPETPFLAAEFMKSCKG